MDRITFLKYHLRGVIENMNHGTKLLFLHGPPATGKLTVAKAILKTIPGRLFDNHASIDLAKTIFEFGAPGFWELVNKVKMNAIESSAEHGVPFLLYTSCYSHPEDYENYKKMEEVIARYNGKVMPVFLSCSDDALKARVANPDRVKRGKVSSIEELEEFLKSWNMAPIPRPNCLRLNSEKDSPEEIAKTIVRHFELKP